MSRDLERAKVVEHALAQWAVNIDGPLAIPNQPFTTPTNGPFGVLNIVERGVFRRSLGMSFFKRNNATLQLDIYSPSDTGTSRARKLADRLEGIYEILILPLSNGQQIVFGTPSSRTLALNEQRAANLDDNWDRYVFEAPYYRDQRVTK